MSNAIERWAHCCFVGRTSSEEYFHMQKTPYPGEEPQTTIHSFCCSPSPHLCRPTLDESSQQKKKKKKRKTHFFHQLLKVMRRRRQNFRILKTMVSGKTHGAASVRGRWANFRVTSANTNNCSGSLSLSALEV